MMLVEVQPPVGINDIPSARLAIERSYALMGRLSQAGAAQIAMLKEVARSGVLTPAQLTTINQQLTITGSAPLDLTGLIPFGGGSVVFGTWAEMKAATPSGLFYVTDRTGLWAANGTTWTLMAGNQGGSDAAKYSDLGLADEGYIWFSQDRGTILRWTGAAWRWESGTYTAAWASLPNPATVSAASGVYFSASDRGYQLWRYDRAGLKWDFVGGGTPTSGVIANITAALTANDVGYLYYATDFDRVYVWTGAAYADAYGQPAREDIHFFTTAPPGNGWQLCDGTPNVTISTATGGTGLVTPPNMTAAPTWVVGDGVVAAGTFGAVGAVYASQSALPYMRL